MKHLRIFSTTLLALGLLVGCAQSDRSSEALDKSVFSPEMSRGGSAAPAPSIEEMGYNRQADRASGTEGDMMMAGNKAVATDSISSIMSSSAAKGGPLNDTSYQFIRTADVRMRVQNVRQATFAIEKITAGFDGYVAHTGLESVVNREDRKAVSEDSTLITTYYTVSNNFVLRVPVAHLDSTLRTIGFLAEYLDYRRIHAENATLLILRERLQNRRINHTTARLEDAADDGNAKLRDRAAVEEALYQKQTAADESLIRTLELKDQIKLSTISLQIYQREAFTREMVANEKNIDAYKPGFWSDAGDALKRGWQGLLGMVIGILHLWPMIGFMAMIGAVILYLRRRKSKGGQA
jgi:Domain of unknown function (DUF4349)